MVTSEINNGLGSIVLTPNRSATWSANRNIICALGCVTLFIGSIWANMGVYMVLPFAGLEVALLAYFLHRVSVSTYRQQVLTFGSERIEVELGVQFPTESWSLIREQSYFSIEKPNHPLDGPVISICDQKQRVELSPFLNKEDRDQLLKVVRSLGLRLKHQNQLDRLDA